MTKEAQKIFPVLCCSMNMELCQHFDSSAFSDLNSSKKAKRHKAVFGWCKIHTESPPDVFCKDYLPFEIVLQ